MAVKTFTDLTTLPASDINTYLANAGLVYIKQQTVGTAVTTVTVTGAFSADYDNYLVTYTGGSGSATNPITVRLGGTTTGYYGTLIYGTFATALVNANVNDNNGIRWTYVGATSTTFQTLQMNLYGPFLTTRTVIAAQYTDVANAGTFTGYLADNTSYTAFTLAPSTGTMTGGIIRVYGYRVG